MKKLIILTLALMMTISLAACGRLAGGVHDTGSPISESPVKSPETEDPVRESPVNSTVPENNKFFIGLWHSMNMVAAGFGERYALNEDGTFIFGASQMEESNSQLYAAGIWSISNGELKLEVSERLIIPVGDISEIVTGDDLIILDRGVVKRIYNPPEIETCSIAKAGTDSETGRNTITLDGKTFFDFNNQTDMFDDYYYLINSSGSSSSE